jgi:multidrug efflux pump subunit AcrA (membrane-fusion protein)
VRTIQAESGPLVANRVTSATIFPVRESQVGATASGRVIEVLVQQGSRVERGQVVLRLDPANAQTAVSNAQLALTQAQINLTRTERATSGSLGPLQASLESALASLRAARQRYTEGQELFRAGAIAYVELTGLDALYQQARAAADSAGENLARTQRASSEELALLRIQVQQAQNQLAQAQRALNETQVRAPFAGVVAEVFLNPGEFVAAGHRAFRLADTSSLEARFRLPPEDAAVLPAGSRVSLLYGGQSYPATIGRSSQVPGTDRLVELTARVTSNLPPGASVQVGYALTLATGTLIPSGALKTEGRTTYVYLVQDARALRQPVQVLGDTGARAAVGGVAPGASIVFPVPASLNTGDLLEVVP